MPSVQMSVAVILLNKGGRHFRIQNIENLLRCGFENIVSFEADSENYSIENFAQRFPCVKFIVPLEKATDGELINIGMSEVTADYVLVLRDSLAISECVLTPRLAEKLQEGQPFCIAPHLLLPNASSFPNVFAPSVRNSELVVDAESIISDGAKTLFPFDFIGLYNRKKFIQLGGYDYTLIPPYWQNLDLSFRAWLWGEEILLSTVFNLSYLEDPPANNITTNLYASRFYLKNLLPRFVNDHGCIPRSSFLVYYRRSACGFFEALSQFGDARYWVEKNKYRFRCDALSLVKDWGKLK